jgi:hypothetical protein
MSSIITSFLPSGVVLNQKFRLFLIILVGLLVMVAVLTFGLMTEVVPL